MIYVGIISDTHIGYQESKTINLGIPLVVLSEIRKCDLIVHGGDIGRCRETLSFLGQIAPVIAVKGNHDKHTKEKIPLKVRKEFAGWQVGITHGHGDNVRRDPLSIIKFFKEPLDVIIYGHIHRPLAYVDRDLILLNAGSLSGTAYTPFPSFMTAAFHEDRLEIKIFSLDQKREKIKEVRNVIFGKKVIREEILSEEEKQVFP